MKKRDTNSYTPHSIAARKTYSAAWTAKNTTGFTIKFNKNDPEQIKIFADFKNLPQESNRLKMIFLIQFYLNHKP
jgi:hypothetical protein